MRKVVLAVAGVMLFLVFLVFLTMMAPPEIEEPEYEAEILLPPVESEIVIQEAPKDKPEDEMTLQEKYQKATEIKNEWLEWKRNVLLDSKGNYREPWLWQAFRLYADVAMEKPEALRDYLELAEAVYSLSRKEIKALWYENKLDDFFSWFSIQSAELFEKSKDKELSRLMEKVYGRILAQMKKNDKDFNPALRYRYQDIEKRWKNRKEMSPDPFRCSSLAGQIGELYLLAKALKWKKEISKWGRHLGDFYISQHTCDEVDWSPSYEEAYKLYVESGHLADARKTARDAGESDLDVFVQGRANVWGFEDCGSEYCVEPYREEEIKSASEWFKKAGWSETAISARVKKILAAAAAKAEKESDYKAALKLYSDERLADQANAVRMRMLLGDGENQKFES